MKKEALKLANIKSDLDKMADFYMSNCMDVKLGYAIPILFLAVIIGILMRRVWIGLLIASLSTIDIVRFIKDAQAYRNTKQLIKATVERGDISISVETLDHIAEETIYEPYTTGVRGEAHRRNWKTVRMFYFEGGGSWRVPDVNRHYAWSEDYYMSPAGLCNSSTEGEKFFFVCLQGYYDIAYIYPCDRFELGELKTGREDGI